MHPLWGAVCEHPGFGAPRKAMCLRSGDRQAQSYGGGVTERERSVTRGNYLTTREPIITTTTTLGSSRHGAGLGILIFTNIGILMFTNRLLIHIFSHSQFS
jgi:hypothetical protein